LRPDQADPYLWHRVKELKDGMGALFQPQSDRERARQNWTEEKRQEWERQQRIKKETEAREYSNKIEATARLEETFGERDRQYRQYIKSRPLSGRHYQNLKERGLSAEAIKLGSFGSSERGGMICPAFWGDKIIGFQWRKDPSGFGQIAGGKYIWSKSPINSKLPNGEMPITALGTAIDGVGNFSEGILKPEIAQSLRGGLWLGAAGGNFPALITQKAIKDFGIKKAIFWPDGGSRVNAHVKASYRNLKALLDKEGIELQFADWGQWDDKSQPDCDELPEGTTIQFKSAVEFFGHEQPSPPYNPRTRWEDLTDEEKAQWKLKTNWENWEKGYAFSNARQIKGDWFDPSLPGEGVLFAGKAPLGAGKTTWMVEFFKAKRGHSIHDWGIRNTLKLQVASLLKDEGVKHLREDDAFELLQDEGAKLTYCIHSLPAISYEELEGKWLILDEATSIVRALLFDNLLQKRGEKVYAEIMDKFAYALGTCKGIIALDGYLADWCIDFLAALAPHLEIQKYQLKKPSPEVIHWHQGCFDSEGKLNSKDFSSLLAALQDALAAGENVHIATDSQRQAEALDITLSNLGYLTHRIDSKTSDDPLIKRLLANPASVIADEGSRVLITSPAAESGLNVDILNYFHLQICLFVGVLEADKLCQMIYRVRYVGERHVWCSARGIGNEGFPGTYPRSVQRAILNHCIQDIFDAGGDGKSISLKLERPQDICAAKVIARSNWEHSHLAECVQKLLIKRGATINESTAESVESLKKANKELKAEIGKTEAKQEFNSRNINDSEANTIKRNMGASWEDRCAARKHSLMQMLKGIENDPVWSWEFIHLIRSADRGIINQCKRWILMDDEIGLPLHQNQWRQSLTYGANLWGWRSDRAIVVAIKELGLLELPDTFTANSPEVVALMEKWNSSAAIKARLKRPSGKDSIKAIGWLCQKLGLRVGTKKVVQGTRFYSISYSKHETPEWVAIESRLRPNMEAKVQELAENPPLESDLSKIQPKPPRALPVKESGESELGCRLPYSYNKLTNLHPELENYFYNLSALADDPTQGDAETLAVLTEGLTDEQHKQIRSLLTPEQQDALRVIAEKTLPVKDSGESNPGCRLPYSYNQLTNLHPELEGYFYKLSTLADDPTQGDAETLAVLTEGLTDEQHKQIRSLLTPEQQDSLKVVEKTFELTPEREALIRESTELFQASGLAVSEFKAIVASFRVGLDPEPCMNRNHLSTPMLRSLVRILAGKVKVADPPDPPKSTEPTSHELLKLAHALFLKLVSSGLSKAELRGFLKRRYGKLTKFAMTREELQDFIRLLKLYGTAICSRVTGEFDPPTQIQLDFW
jgi:hypothetical protein